MNSFAMLTNDEGTVSTARAGKMLRELYGMSSRIQITPLRQDECTWFGVRDGSSARQMLRVSEFGRRTQAEMESEIVWIAELAHDTELLIPRPVAGRSGGYVQTLGAPGEPDGGVCVLFSLPETALIGCGSGGQHRVYRQLGEIAAMLHQNALLWDAGEKLSRRTLPYDSILTRRPAERTDTLFSSDILPGLLVHAAETVRRRLSRYSRTEDRFGLIHGALHPEILLSMGERVGVLDFDACEFGWFLYDFAISADGVSWEHLPAATSSWLDGYRSKRKISRREAQMLPSFVMLRRLEQLAADPACMGATASFASSYLRDFG